MDSDTPKRKAGRPVGSKGKVSLRLVPKAGMQPAIARKITAKASQSDTPNPGPEQPMAATPSGRKTKQRSSPLPHLGVTDKQEAFCQAVLSGLSLSDAYRSAYVTDNMAGGSIHVAASKLFSDPKIRQRMQSINMELEANRRMMATSDAALAIRVLRELAERADTDAARIRAAELLAKAGGVFVEQLDITDKRDRSEDEIEDAIKAKLQRLGLAS
jgi:phage terminase small subunit